MAVGAELAADEDPTQKDYGANKNANRTERQFSAEPSPAH
jgi:hypothetical protein